MIPLDLGWLPLDLFYSAVGFVAVTSFFAGLVALPSGSLTVAAVPAYVMFAWLSMHSGIQILTNVFMSTTVLITLGFAFKMWRLEGA